MAKRRRVAAEKDYAISKASSGKRLAAPRLPISLRARANTRHGSA